MTRLCEAEYEQPTEEIDGNHWPVWVWALFGVALALVVGAGA